MLREDFLLDFLLDFLADFDDDDDLVLLLLLLFDLDFERLLLLLSLLLLLLVLLLSLPLLELLLFFFDFSLASFDLRSFSRCLASALYRVSKLPGAARFHPVSVLRSYSKNGLGGSGKAASPDDEADFFLDDLALEPPPAFTVRLKPVRSRYLRKQNTHVHNHSVRS